MALKSFAKLLSTFKRQEIAYCSTHLTRMVLTVAQETNGKQVLVVEGASRKDEDGRLASEPLILGAVANRDYLHSIGKLLRRNIEGLSLDGDYSWSLIGGPKLTPGQNLLWSICWANSQNDPDGVVPDFLLLLTEQQMLTVRNSYPNPNDHELLKLAAMAVEYNRFCENKASIRRMFDRRITKQETLDAASLKQDLAAVMNK